MVEDRDCQNARHEVVIAESTLPVGFKTSEGCHVVSRNWSDPYSSKTIKNASNLDIDQLVPLKGFMSGGFVWDAAKRRDYANELSDPNTLIGVDQGRHILIE